MSWSPACGMHAWQVITPSAGGPAERAGIAPHDGLVAIGDRKTEGLSLYEAGDLLQGAEGSEVNPPYGPCMQRLLCPCDRVILSTFLSGHRGSPPGI